MVEERKQQIQGLVQFCSHCIDVLPYSSETGLGRDQLWGIIKRESASDSIIGKQS
jgi:hypothetical protein